MQELYGSKETTP